MENVVVFLQNAWSPLYAGSTWPRENWLVALGRSRSGHRLKLLVPDLHCCENTTPIVGAMASSVVTPDEIHIKKILQRRMPEHVVACGKQAEKALLKLWDGPLLAIAHPAHRFVTDAIYLEARKIITEGFTGRIKLQQEIGKVERVTL